MSVPFSVLSFSFVIYVGYIFLIFFIHPSPLCFPSLLFPGLGLGAPCPALARHPFLAAKKDAATYSE